MLTNLCYLGTMFYFAFQEYQDIEKAVYKVGFFMIAGINGFFFLETIEYIEHYGLIYRQDVDKKEVNEISSWNA